MVTLKQISDESGFSIRTVSVALNGDPVSGRISETCVQKIKKIARERGYKVSAAARAIRLKRTSQVGVLVRNDAENPRVDPASYETILGINQQMEQMDYIVSMIRYTDVADQFASQSRVFKEQVLDGIITIGNIPLNCCSTIFKAIKTCVWVDNNASNLQHTVSRDEHHAGWLAAHHVCQLGYRQVYWLGPTPDALGMHISVLQRYEGVMSCFNEQGITPRVRLLPYWNPEVDLDELAQTFKPQNVVIAYNTELATHITHLALSMGYRVGHDFGLVCCEDSANTHDNWPGLSRVSFDRYHMGKIAADMLLNLLNRPKEQSLPSQVLPVHWLPGNTAWGPRGH